MRTTGVAGALVAAALGLTAVGAQAQEPIKIGASLPLTGNFSVNGEKHQQGFQLCVDLINEKGGLLGRQVELIVSDNRSDTETAISQYERLINVDKVGRRVRHVLLQADLPDLVGDGEYNMIHPVPSGGALRIWAQGFKHIFYFQQNAAELVGSSLTELIAERVPEADRPKTAAVVYADDFYANAHRRRPDRPSREPGRRRVVDLAPGALAGSRHRGRVRASSGRRKASPTGSPRQHDQGQRRRPGDRFTAFARRGDPADPGAADRGLSSRRARDPRARAPRPSSPRGLGDAAEGIMIHSAWHPAVPWSGCSPASRSPTRISCRRWNERFGRDPDEDEAIPFATCQGMEQAIRATGSTDNDVLRDWLPARTAEEPVKTILGDFHWDERGLPRTSPS